VNFASFPFDVLFQTDQYLIIDKPAGIHSVELPNEKGGTSVAGQLVAFDNSFALIAPTSGDGGLVHRLDQHTSGALLVAKNNVAWHSLHTLLAAGAVKKSYAILVTGQPLPRQKISGYLGSRYRGSKKVVHSEQPQDRMLPASTSFELTRYFANSAVSLTKALAPTARRHQVRAHAAALGFPLVGDMLYGSKVRLSDLAVDLVLPDFLLHAETISFLDPFTNKAVEVRSPLSMPCQQLLGMLS